MSDLRTTKDKVDFLQLQVSCKSGIGSLYDLRRTANPGVLKEFVKRNIRFQGDINVFLYVKILSRTGC